MDGYDMRFEIDEEKIYSADIMYFKINSEEVYALVKEYAISDAAANSLELRILQTTDGAVETPKLTENGYISISRSNGINVFTEIMLQDRWQKDYEMAANGVNST